MKIVYVARGLRTEGLGSLRHGETSVYSSLANGFKRHNQQLIHYSGSLVLEDILQVHSDADLLIGKGLYKHTTKLWKSSVREQWLNTKMNFISIEHGPGRYRKQTFAMGYNGMMGEANFINSNSDDKRWLSSNSMRKQIKRQLKPWRSEDDGEYVLIIYQKPGDSSLKSKTSKIPPVNIEAWVNEQRIKYKNLGYKVRVRTNAARRLRKVQPLEGDFAGAKFVVVCSSNCGVLAVEAGVPTVATHPISMVYDICKHTKTPDRLQWVKDLSYCNWTLEEIATGEAWSHLKQADFKNMLDTRDALD